MDTATLFDALESSYATPFCDTEEDILRVIAETMEQGLLAHDGKQIVASNERLSALLECPPELTAPGTPISDFVHFAEERGDYKHCRNISVEEMSRRIGASEDFTMRRQVPGGAMVQAEYRKTGDLSVIVYRDITRQRERDALMETMLSTIAQGVLIHDENEIVTSNARLTELLNLPGDLVCKGGSWEDFVKFRIQRGDYGKRGLEHLEAEKRAFAEGKSFSSQQTACTRAVQNECRFENGLMFVTFTDITEAKRQERQLRHSQARIRRMADRDALTDLVNRRAFDNALEDRMRDIVASDGTVRDLSLLMIDLDRFKPINDNYGHAIGDALLKAVSERFLHAVRGTDIVARIGGDEFSVICEDCSTNKAQAIAERVLKSISKPFRINGIDLSVGVSIGVACYNADMASFDELISAADLALYAAKDKGRGCVALFRPDMAETAQIRLQLETDLRSAVENDELVLHYQVQRDLKSSSEVGYEALMRWQHPDFGMIPPNDFIPIAEDTGMIVKLGRWALHRATSDFVQFDDKTRIAVNVSPAQFKQSDLVRDVSQALEASGLAPERLEIEVTEQLLMEDTDSTLVTLNELRSMGVSLSLDDFGSGYSSLAYLTQFPFTKIKIDRYFIARMLEDPRSKSLVTSILALAMSLGMKVTAEGVETGEQLAALTQSNCDEAQGYLLGRPAPLDAIISRIAGGNTGK